MRIAASDVSLASSRISIATSSVQEHLRKWDGTTDVTYDSEKINGSIVKESMQKRDVARISSPPPRVFPKIVPDPTHTSQKKLLKGIDEAFIGDIKVRIMKDIIQRNLDSFLEGGRTTGEILKTTIPCRRNPSKIPHPLTRHPPWKAGVSIIITGKRTIPKRVSPSPPRVR